MFITTTEFKSIFDKLVSDFDDTKHHASEVLDNEDITAIISRINPLDVLRELDNCGFNYEILNSNSNTFTKKFILLMGIIERIVKLNKKINRFNNGDIVRNIYTKEIFVVDHYEDDEIFVCVDNNERTRYKSDSDFVKIGDSVK